MSLKWPESYSSSQLLNLHGWKSQMGASRKRCWRRCPPAIEMKTLLLSNLLSQCSEQLDRFDKGVRSTGQRSILYGYCHICPFRDRFSELFLPILTLTIHCQHSIFSHVRINSQGCFTSLVKHLLLSGIDLSCDIQPTLTGHAHCRWF